MRTDNQTQELSQKEQNEIVGGNLLVDAVKALAAALMDLLSYKGPQA